MYQDSLATGPSLDPKQLCLTFDDGPGQETLELAQYLHEQGVPATFFMVGKHAERYSAWLPQIQNFGDAGHPVTRCCC